MTKIFNITLLAVIALMFGSCTHNDGDIGPFFGLWRLEAMEVNSQPVDLYNGDDGVELYTLAFQSEIVMLQTITHHNDYRRAFGNWRRDGSRLTLNFDHTDDDDATKYVLPAGLGFEPVMTFDILKFTSSDLTLRFVSSEGHTRTYYFEKTR